MRELDAIEEGLYPMRVVTRLTGLTPDTVRVWERRYGAVVPQRTEGNARRFTAEDVRRLLLMREATSRGHAIRDIAVKSQQELEELLGATTALRPDTGQERSRADEPYAGLRDEYLELVGRFEVRRGAELLGRSAALIDPMTFILDVIVPILREAGARWASDKLSVAHEHLVTAQVKGLLFSMLRYVQPQRGAAKIIFTTPAGHLHEFGILIAAFLAAQRGHEPVYLGPNMPTDDIIRAAESGRADLVVMGIPRDVDVAERSAVTEGVRRLRAHASVWLGLPTGHDLVSLSGDVRIFHSFQDLDLAFTDLLL